MNDKQQIDDTAILKLCDQIRQTAFNLHVYLRHGHLEKVYENGIVNRLRKMGISCEQQLALEVYDEDGTVLGDYFADVFLKAGIILELKACKTLLPEHDAQIFGYLRASNIRHGMLINFGAPKIQIKKFVL